MLSAEGGGGENARLSGFKPIKEMKKFIFINVGNMVHLPIYSNNYFLALFHEALRFYNSNKN
jgi:hypothetical protein